MSVICNTGSMPYLIHKTCASYSRKKCCAGRNLNRFMDHQFGPTFNVSIRSLSIWICGFLRGPTWYWYIYIIYWNEVELWAAVGLFILSHFACRRDAVRFVSLHAWPASNCLTISNQTRIIPARARLWSSNFLPMQIGERMTQRAWLCSLSINLLTLVLLNSFNFNYIHNYI